MTTLTVPTNLDINISPVVHTMEELSINPKVKKKDHDSMEIAKILDQSKKRLNSLDAQRVISVLDDTIRRCEVVTLLPYIIENLDRYSVMLGADLLAVLKEYDLTQQLYMKSLSNVRKLSRRSSRPASRNSLSEIMESSHERRMSAGSPSPEYVAAVESTNRLSSNLSTCVQTIGRMFKQNPVALNVLKSQGNERSYEANALIDHLLCLREELFTRLVTTANEEQEKLRMSVQILKREKKAKSVIKKLDLELNDNMNEMKAMIQSKNDIIRSLKSTILTFEQESDIVNRKMVNDAKKIESSDTKNSEIMQSKLQQDIISLKQQLQTNTQKHREDELLMRKRKFKIETEVENWVQKYDNDMTEKQSELDDIGAIYSEEKNQLEQLEERFETLESNYKRIVEERRIAQEKKEEEEREMIRRGKAATLIQSYWRSFKVRKNLKAKQKKGKKGKGGKKKKK